MWFESIHDHDPQFEARNPPFALCLEIPSSTTSSSDRCWWTFSTSVQKTSCQELIILDRVQHNSAMINCSRSTAAEPRNVAVPLPLQSNQSHDAAFTAAKVKQSRLCKHYKHRDRHFQDLNLEGTMMPHYNVTRLGMAWPGDCSRCGHV